MPRSGASLLYGLTLFGSAFLLFWVEPMAGKLLLPVFGGAPAVWNVCLFFFQAALLGGYVYAHLLSSRLPFGWGAIVHLVLLAGAFWLLPASLREATSGDGRSLTSPALEVLRLLSLGIGLPFLLVSATASLAQSWFGGSSHARAADPYFLYSASNLGSLLALLAYPSLIEPFFPVRAQWSLWKRGYLAMALALGLCALWRRRRAEPAAPEAALDTASRAESPSDRQAGRRRALDQALKWTLWSFVPSSLLLGVTSYLSTDIIAVPLLWTIPLIIYLGAFAFVFAGPRFAAMTAHPLLTRALCLGTTICILGIIAGFAHPASLFLPLHLAVFGLGCLICLGRVARERPAPSELTRYFLFIAIGGSLGGILNGLIAPSLFNEICEYPAMMILACLCRPRPATASLEKRDLLAPLFCALLILAPFAAAQAAGIPPTPLLRAWIIGPAALACYATIRRPIRLGLSLAVLYFVGTAAFARLGQEPLLRQRSFFGTLKVLYQPRDRLRYLVHGSTSHGAQATDPGRQLEPLTYYSRSGPAGQIFEELGRRGPRDAAGARIGVIGLGTGTLSAYARAGESWTFFELDPGVVRIASDPAYFSFLRDSAAARATSVVLGDARLRIRDVPDGALSLLVVDAFSSDSVPAHLLTREAQTLYLRKLAPGGWLAFHVSNRFLTLAPVVGAVASELGAVARVRADLRGLESATEPAPSELATRSPSIWVLVARKDEDLGAIARDRRWQRIAGNPRFAWTDDFYGLLGLVQW